MVIKKTDADAELSENFFLMQSIQYLHIFHPTEEALLLEEL